MEAIEDMSELVKEGTEALRLLMHGPSTGFSSRARLGFGTLQWTASDCATTSDRMLLSQTGCFRFIDCLNCEIITFVMVSLDVMSWSHFPIVKK